MIDSFPKMLILKNSYIVKPADPTPHEIMCVSELDQFKPLTHTPLICFYRPCKESVQVQEAVRVLKDSLSKVLVIFYPFAGRLQWIGGGRVEIHCNSMGAVLLEAETQLKIDDLGDFSPGPEITALLPSVDHEATPLHEVPLLLIQITKFACGGLGLGLKLSHILVDGRSTFKFLPDWVKIARGEKSIDPPFFDRNILEPKKPYPNPLTEKFSHLTQPPLLIGQTDCSEQRNKPTTVLVLKLSKEQVQKLKDKANRTIEIVKQGYYPDGRKLSRFEAVTAHVWRCASKARKHSSDQETCCYVTVDTRQILTPKLPKTYFGNGVLLVAIITTAGELLSRPLGHAAGKVREAIKSVTNEYVRSFLISCKNLSDVSFLRQYHIVGHSKGIFYGNPNICVTSWIGLQDYPLDFGWGGEFYMGPGSIGYDGRVLFIPSHDKDGSFLLPIRLQVEHVDAFRKYFYDEIIDHQSLRPNL